MTEIFSCICCRCQRLISLNDLIIFEGRDYHDSCYLKTVRTRISEIDKKIQRATATILDTIELKEQIEIERIIKRDMENPNIDFGHVPNPPVFKGNTPLGLTSAMNPPKWKRILHEKGTLKGTKYQFSKKVSLPISTDEPIFKIITDEYGYKSCIQIGSKPIENNILSLPLELKTKLSEVSDESKIVHLNQEIQ